MVYDFSRIDFILKNDLKGFHYDAFRLFSIVIDRKTFL